MHNTIPTAKSPAAFQSAQNTQLEFVPLPAKGGDIVFGLSRSFWYKVERAGLLQLRRIRRPGCLRGRALLPVPEARAALEKMASDGKHLCPANRAAS